MSGVWCGIHCCHFTGPSIPLQHLLEPKYRQLAGEGQQRLSGSLRPDDSEMLPCGLVTLLGCLLWPSWSCRWLFVAVVPDNWNSVHLVATGGAGGTVVLLGGVSGCLAAGCRRCYSAKGAASSSGQGGRLAVVLIPLEGCVTCPGCWVAGWTELRPLHSTPTQAVSERHQCIQQNVAQWPLPVQGGMVAASVSRAC